MKGLTKRQSQILSLINSFIKTKGFSPSYRELTKLASLSSPATLHKHIENLKKLGYLEKLPRGARGLKITKSIKSSAKRSSNIIPVIGELAKGQKIALYPHASTFEIPESLVSPSSALYGFIVKDSSFSHHQMRKGDLLVVDARRLANLGDFVVAKGKSRGCDIVEYPLPEPTQIQGVIIALFRKYVTTDLTRE